MSHRSASSHTSSVHDGWVFAGLLALLVWAPVPLGSNRTWAIGILLLLVLVLLVGTLLAWRHRAGDAVARLARFGWPLALLACMVLWSWAQTLEMPAAWVTALSPVAAAAQAPARG